MADRNPNRRQLEYEEIQSRKKRQMDRQREMQKRSQANYDALTESQREQMEYRKRQQRKAEYQRRQEEQRRRAEEARQPESRKPKRSQGTKPKRPRESAEILEERRRQARRAEQNARPTKKNTRKQGKAQKTQNKKVRASRRKKSVFGMILCVIQVLLSCLFMFSLFMLNILPEKYLAIIAGVLAVLALIVFLTQRHPKNKGILGKLLSIFMSIVLAFGSFYVIKTNGLMSDIFGSTTKTNEMVVAVLKDDPAESLADTTNYSFGVQYASGADSEEAAVTDIESQVGAINLTEYESVQAEAQALIDGEVDAIIYGASFTSLMDDAVSGYSDSIKIIYKNKMTVSLTTNEGNAQTITEPFSVYISGIDVYGDVAQNSRSDVNIIATVNPKTHQILLTSTPRDFYVTIPEISGGEYDKLTHAGIYGVDASIATLENLYDTEIDFYARLNFTSLINIVDELGGLDVYSEYTFTTSEDSGCVFDVVEGYNTLNGEQALAFARERQNVPEGDEQRGRDQQAVITAMIKKMLSPAMLIRANGLIDSLSGNIETSMSLDQMHGLVKSQLRTNAKWSITSVEPSGTYDTRTCYSSGDQPLFVTIPDESTIYTIIEQINQVEAGEALEGAEVLN